MDCEEVIKENVLKYSYVSNEGFEEKKRRFNVFWRSSNTLNIIWGHYIGII